MDRRRDAAPDRSRGATLVEYALIVGLVASVAMVSVEGMRTSASKMFGTVKRDIAVGDSSVEAAGTEPPAPTTTPTTAAPTTVATTTTTTTTTTTAPTTTTTTAPKVTKGGGTFSPATTTVVAGFWWAAQTSLTVRGTDGKPVAGAEMTVLVRYQQRDFYGNLTWREDEVTATTGADGTVTVTGGPWVRPAYGSGATKVEFSLVGGTLPGGLTWDGTQATVTANAP